jgi:hypothetical protein
MGVEGCRVAGSASRVSGRGPTTNEGELVQVHDDRTIFQASPDELPVIDIHSL